jgi:hypothetical protein
MILKKQKWGPFFFFLYAKKACYYNTDILIKYKLVKKKYVKLFKVMRI